MKKEDGLCLSDFVSETQTDTVAMFVVSVGKNVAEKAEELKNEGHYLHSHILSALAIELAEAYAELLHEKLGQARDVVAALAQGREFERNDV